MAKAIAELQKDPNVLYAEPNYRIYFQETIPNDFYFRNLWGLDNSGQEFRPGFLGTPGVSIDAPRAWNLFTGSRTVVVGVIDSGMDYRHPDLVNNMWRNPGETGLDLAGRDKATNGVDDDGNGFVDDVHGILSRRVGSSGDPRDTARHGTQVAGVIGAQGNNGIGVVGVNWNVAMTAVAIEPSSFGATQAVRYISQLKRTFHETGGRLGANIRVVNDSWIISARSQALYEAFKEAETLDIIHVVAAGNNEQNIDVRPDYPASYINDPSGPLKNIVGVLATDANDKRPFWSNYGYTTILLGAPGENILSTVRPLVAGDYDRAYGYVSGTSFATPYVTGAIGLLLGYLEGRGETLTMEQIIERVGATGQPVHGLRNRTISGRRLNVYNLLTNTRPALPASPTTTLTITTNKSTYRPGERVTLTFRARSTTGTVAGVPIQFSARRPDGVTIRGTQNLSVSGTYTINYMVPRSNGLGSYTVLLNITDDTYNDANVIVPAALTFTVN